jgi:hypothetical protein
VERYDVDVRSWVRADRAELPLHDVITHWLATAWPFRAVEHAAR